MSYETVAVNIFPKYENIIGEFGNVVLKEKVWGIEILPKQSSFFSRKLKLSKSNILEPHSRSRYITVKEAIQNTQLSYSKIMKGIKSNEIEAVKIHGKWLILKKSLDEYKKILAE